MAVINVPHKVRKSGTIRVRETRSDIKTIIADAKRSGVGLITLTEVLGTLNGRDKTFDIKHSLINGIED